jgi:hypothetical protein
MNDTKGWDENGATIELIATDIVEPTTIKVDVDHNNSYLSTM